MQKNGSLRVFLNFDQIDHILIFFNLQIPPLNSNKILISYIFVLIFQMLPHFDDWGQNGIAYYIAQGYHMSMYAKNCIHVCIFQI